MTEKGKYRVCGALAGTVNGLFGGGGGIPLVFLLRSWAKLSDKMALATCVAVIFPFCLVSVLVYAFRGALPLGEALPYLVGGLAGGWIGGIPLVFLLRSWAKLSDKMALATCVAVIFPFCLVSVLVYAFRGALPLGEALPYLVGGLAGGWIGGRLFKDVPNTWLKRIFALFLLYGAVRYLL